MYYLRVQRETSRRPDGNRSRCATERVAKASQEIHTSATCTPYLVCFVLDTTGFPLHNPASSLLLGLLRPLGDSQLVCCGHWGKQHAIFAGLDRAVHQPGMFSARPLAARVSFGPQRWFGILPQLRIYVAGGASANRAAAAHASARAGGTSTAAAQAALVFSRVLLVL